MDDEKLYNEVVRAMSKWSPKGEKLLSNGVRLICPTPQVAPEAWLHVLYPPLALEKVEGIEKRLGRPLPDDFKFFLRRINGLQMFSYRISIWGLRQNMARTGDEAWQPYDLVDHNAELERPENSPEEVVYFAGTDGGRYWCFFEFKGKSYRIGKTDRRNFHPDSYWSDFGSWLLDEIGSLEIRINLNGEMEDN
ncbi:MAG: SMI1/KNR4 family protein [Blastocatellia bacterium]|nr:SMI1/KNR4 family protein [Blastocatellia bacterium]